MNATSHSAQSSGPATANRATLCAYCGQPISVASNPLGQTPIAYYHGDCYRESIHAREGDHVGPIHLMSHDELVQDGHLFP